MSDAAARMRAGGMVGGFFCAFVPPRTAPNDFAHGTWLRVWGKLTV